ncbi:hypothetical protein ASZ90_012328 [hydrocarbon metagenome]|uniref:Nucleoside phosphorylase domain-containing protein n=1 Tax=hydrocarbon metagenome TaxID=938273 RepID=A0A0W8FAT5_9ZZZZ|nr:hypothetical protein [Methanothrix sp.]MBP7066709.1 hypothetical protein [Methanothrix sp.]
MSKDVLEKSCEKDKAELSRDIWRMKRAIEGILSYYDILSLENLDFLREKIYFYFPLPDATFSDHIKKLLDQDFLTIENSGKPTSALKQLLTELIKSYEMSLSDIEKSIEKTEGMLLASIDVGDPIYASDYESYCLFCSSISSDQISDIIKRWKEDYRSRWDKKSHIFWMSADYYYEIDAISYYRFMEIFKIKDFSETMNEIEESFKESIKDDKYNLFLACRSPLLCSKLGTYLEDALKIELKSQDIENGWWPSINEFPRRPDAYATALSCCILLKLSQQHNYMDKVYKSISWLVKEQGSTGAWHSSFAKDYDDDLLTTILAVQAIRSSGIDGYEYALSLAEKWIIDQQCKDGDWSSSFPLINHLVIEYFKEAKNVNSKVSMSDIGPKSDILIVTTTTVESQALMKVFKEATGKDPNPVEISKRIYHDLGKVNGARIFMALSEMGSSGPGASQQAVQKGISALCPSAVILVGVAFGINEQKQAIGDILVSQQLLLYDLQRIGNEKIIIRGDKPHSSTWLFNRFNNNARIYWTRSKVHSGPILTGEKLIDNVDYRDKLKTFEPEAIGGEMEGAGLYVACQDAKVDWILVKAICDWADGNKAQDKDKRQQLAADNAAQFVLDALKLAPFEMPNQ